MVLVTKKRKSLSGNQRKRQGFHHKRDSSYHKPYWPYLPLLGIIGFGFILNLLWTPINQASLSRQHVLSFTTSTSISGLLTETNNQRATHGIAELQLNSQLNAAAQAKANDMAARNYWSHTTPDGAEPWVFVANAGYDYYTAGENLAYGFDSSSTAVTGWMNSPGHRANLLNTTFADIGFGIANAEDFQGYGQQTVIVAMYGSLAPVVAPATPTVAHASTTPLVSQPQRISRLQLMVANTPAWAVGFTTLAVATFMLLFTVKHLRSVHRTFVRGERFLVSHVAFDFLTVGCIVLGMLLTRTAGFIN